MQRTSIIVAFFFAWINCFSQSAGTASITESTGQYPFVYYTPKQGLVNSRVRNIMQDSKGRMLFMTYGGLSIYDGTRFINYSEQDGLANELVNDVVEITPDSFLVSTNVRKLNTLVHGRVGVFETTDGFYPTVNHFLKTKEGELYIAADEGLFQLRGKKFFQLHLYNKDGIDVGRNFDKILEWNNYLFLLPWSPIKERLIVYDKQAKKVVLISTDNKLLNILKDKQGRLWVIYTEGLKLLDTTAIHDGQLNLLQTPHEYLSISRIRNAGVFFDQNNDVWFNAEGHLKIFSLNSPQRLISINKNFSTFTLTNIMQDREGTIWISTDGNGVVKIAGINVQLLNGIVPGVPAYISVIQQQGDTLWFYSPTNNSIIRSAKNQIQVFPLRNDKVKVDLMQVAGNSLYLFDAKKILWIPDKNNIHSYAHPRIQSVDSITTFGTGLVDQHGAIIMHATADSSSYLLVIKDHKIVMRYPLDFMGDQPAIDRSGRLWVITRHNQLMVFTLHPENPSQYLQLVKDFSNELAQMDPRSISIDKNNDVWIGTRTKGVFCLKFDDLTFRSATQFTTKNGLTDNFITYLNCDNDNVVWVGTETGLDKIFLKNNRYVIGNVSKSNNFFQTILRIVTTKDSTVWALTNEGTVLKIFNRSGAATSPLPPSIIATLKINGQAPTELPNKYSYWQNNLTFYVAAPSFVDEKSILYRYVLKGSGNNQWSEPSNNSIFNFINLPPGKYDLQVSSDFPESMYPSQNFSYSFVIRPPWWQTWWFRISAALIFASLVVFSFRYYYRRKLEKQQVILDKQQAVEQERTRIAADMHDDLGAGLTKIRYITENILEKTNSGETAQPELEKLKYFSSELLESMGEIIWATSEKNNLLSNTLYYLRSYAVNYCEENNIDCHFSIPENFKDRDVGGNIRRNIFLLLKESLHNIVKHAAAKTVVIEADVEENLRLIIKDDGKGFSGNGVSAAGNGLINMKKRVRELSGNIHFETNGGTIIRIELPLTPNQSTIG